jgi:guanine deaminase
MKAEFMRAAIKLAEKGMNAGCGGPFGAVVVQRGKVIGRGWNSVVLMNDPTAHAEILAIRDACKRLKTFSLEDCVIYTSCEPCPMCLAAIYWGRIRRVYYANTRQDAAAIGFDDATFYQELALPLSARRVRMTQFLRPAALPCFQAWREKTDKITY